MTSADLAELQKLVGYGFADPSLLRLALTHPSVAHELGASALDNQRLEFLGDAVLQLVLTREVYLRYPGMDEGDLTKARAQLVNRRMLADLGRQLNLGRYLSMSRGEEQSGGRDRLSSLADGFEALIGAIYLDGGLGSAERFIFHAFGDVGERLGELSSSDNPKGDLQELLQTDDPDPPRYEQVSVSGPDHDRDFECAVTHRGVELARGRGKSKKAAESDAALKALGVLRQRAGGDPGGVSNSGGGPVPAG